jgi:hypothetical protein
MGEKEWHRSSVVAWWVNGHTAPVSYSNSLDAVLFAMVETSLQSSSRRTYNTVPDGLRVLGKVLIVFVTVTDTMSGKARFFKFMCALSSATQGQNADGSITIMLNLLTMGVLCCQKTYPVTTMSYIDVYRIATCGCRRTRSVNQG